MSPLLKFPIMRLFIYIYICMINHNQSINSYSMYFGVDL